MWLDHNLVMSLFLKGSFKQFETTETVHYQYYHQTRDSTNLFTNLFSKQL